MIDPLKGNLQIKGMFCFQSHYNWIYLLLEFYQQQQQNKQIVFSTVQHLQC